MQPVQTLFDLRGRSVVITGAGQGIGRAFAKSFAQAGATVVLAEMNEPKAKAVAEEITSQGGKALVIATDVGDNASTQKMAAQVQAQLGKVDVLINNAGIFSSLKMRPFEQIPDDEWERVLHVNITGVFNCCRALTPLLRASASGRIINISSGAVTLGRPNYLHYTTSKAALLGLTRSMARELGPAAITVNAILPGSTHTEIERETVTPQQRQRIVEMQCIPRVQVPEDLVGTAMFLASDASAFLTGQGITVDGGATHT